MAYTFLPVRTVNYFSPSPPYLAGMGLWGLGDYAADMAAYNKAYSAWKTNHLLWENEKHYYEKKLTAYNSTVTTLTSAYRSAVDAYTRDKAAWDKEYTAYQNAISSYNTQYAIIKRSNTDKSLIIARSYGLTLPQSYWDRGACLTQAEHDNYARLCQTVKGLMGTGLGSADPNCGYKLLPVCAFPAKPTLRAQPQPPARPVLPASPTLRAEPRPPVAPIAPPRPITTVTTTSSGGGGGSPASTPTLDTNSSTVPEETPQDDQRRGMIMNGLIIVAVLGGGYLVYRTLKKPKAQAA